MTDIHLRCPVGRDERCTRGCTEPACKKGAEAHALDCQGKHAEANALRDEWEREPLPFDRHLKVGAFARRIRLRYRTDFVRNPCSGESENHFFEGAVAIDDTAKSRVP